VQGARASIVNSLNEDRFCPHLMRQLRGNSQFYGGNMGEMIQTSKGNAYRAAAADGGPGVLVLHAWWGLNEVFKELCDRLAAEGFVALAPDLYGDKIAETVEEAQRLIDERDDEAIFHRVSAAIEALQADETVQGEAFGAIGFSMGAAWALYFSGIRPSLKACVLFYGNGEGDWGAAQAAYLGHFAEADPWEPTEGVEALEQALRTAGREVTFHQYAGTGHWFFENNRPDAYQADAADLAWQRTLAFLHEKLG
jgi:carboxymethylenebutenolidase